MCATKEKLTIRIDFLHYICPKMTTACSRCVCGCAKGDDSISKALNVLYPFLRFWLCINFISFTFCFLLDLWRLSYRSSLHVQHLMVIFLWTLRSKFLSVPVKHPCSQSPAIAEHLIFIYYDNWVASVLCILLPWTGFILALPSQMPRLLPPKI